MAGERESIEEKIRQAMAGEMVWGAAKGHDNVLMLLLGTGVGGAVIVNGRMLRGHFGVAGRSGRARRSHQLQCRCLSGDAPQQRRPYIHIVSLVKGVARHGHR